MNEKILIIDDEPDVMTTIDKILTEEGYKVKSALSGKMAIEILKAENFDLAITDVRMPGMDGLEVIRQAKKLDNFLEIIVLTGYGTIENAVKALKDEGAFDYLTKPLKEIDDLLVTVKKALEKRRLRLKNEELFNELEKEVKERRKIQKRLQKSKTLLQSVFDGISEPLILLHRNMTIKIVNKAARKYYKALEFQDLIDKSCYRELKKLSKPCEGCKIPSAISSSNAITFTRKGFMDPDSLEQVVTYPLENHEGLIMRIRDITKEKRTEEQLIRADRLSSLGQLSGGIAHEIKNPLTGIRLFADLLSDKDKFKLGSHGADILNEIKDNVNKIDGIIKRVLDFAKPSDESLKQVDINRLIQENIKLWSVKFRKSKIELKLFLTENLSHVQGDTVSLQQLINNLVINAIEAMGKGGVLEIKTFETKSSFHSGRDVVIIELKDTGSGIQQENMKDIFTPFFTTKTSGTGLGLAISYQIIKRHGGVISLKSHPGEGTTFKIELPCLSEK